MRDEIIVNPHDFAALEAACQELAERVDPRTFTQIIIDRMFPRPLQAYGSAVWAVGRAHDMHERGLLK